ncbi:glycoside hydrolase family 43 protein [soil metagenome]
MQHPANPILRGLYPDPSICRVGETYYLATSTFEYLPGIPIHSSTDLVHWELVGHALHDPAQFDFAAVPDSRGIFAPTIRHHDGLFYVACTLMDGGAVSGNFYLTAADPAGPWSAPVMLPDARGIDPSLFFHEGRAWWIGCREVAEQSFEGETEVWMRELDLERGALVGRETVIWTRTMYRAVWAEAPHLYERDGWFYLMTAEGGTAFEHSVMIARSRELAGPYLPCPRNPVLTHRHLGHGVPVQNVGHADLVQGHDGSWWMVALATRPIAGHHILGRETHLARVEWENGWPVVNPGRGVLDAPVPRAGHWESAGVPSAADFLSVRGFSTFAEPAEAGLLLRSTGSSLESEAPPAALLRRLGSTDSTVTVTLAELAPGSTAGLVLRQGSHAHVRLEIAASVDGVRARLIARPGEGSDSAGIPIGAGTVVLAARVSADGVAWTVAAGTEPAVELGSTALGVLSTETAGGFVGTTFGPYVSGQAGSSVLFTAWSQDER